MPSIKKTKATETEHQDRDDELDADDELALEVAADNYADAPGEAFAPTPAGKAAIPAPSAPPKPKRDAPAAAPPSPGSSPARVAYDEAKARHAAADAAYRLHLVPGRVGYTPDVPELEAEAKAVAAQLELEAAAAKLNAELETEGLRAGDELTRAASLATTHADLVALVAEEKRAKAALDAVSAQLNARMRKAKKAAAELATQREAAGLPRPETMPTLYSHTGVTIDKTLAALGDRLKKGPPPSDAAKRAELLPLKIRAAKLEAARRAEERAKEEERDRKIREGRAWQAQRDADAKAAEQAAEREADAKRKAEEAALIQKHFGGAA